MNKYNILNVIGKGTYGTVYEGISKGTNEKVAIKKLNTKVKSWNGCVEMSEVRILSKLNHENIIKLKEIIREPTNEVSYIFEYADTNLFEYLDGFRKRKEKIPETKIKSLIYQIVSGVNYLHQNGIMHRDLKPENILLLGDVVKIGDFGVAKEIQKYTSDFSTNVPLTDYVCTRWYRAPECVLKSTEYNEKVDVWAIGCIMAELFNLRPIFPGQDEFDQLNKIVRVLGTPEFAEWPEGYKLIQKIGMKFPICSKQNLHDVIYGAGIEAINMLNEIFVYDATTRSSCSELLNHRFFNECRPGSFSARWRYKDIGFRNKYEDFMGISNNINSKFSPVNQNEGINYTYDNMQQPYMRGYNNYEQSKNGGISYNNNEYQRKESGLNSFYNNSSNQNRLYNNGGFQSSPLDSLTNTKSIYNPGYSSNSLYSKFSSIAENNIMQKKPLIRGGYQYNNPNLKINVNPLYINNNYSLYGNQPRSNSSAMMSRPRILYPIQKLSVY